MRLWAHNGEQLAIGLIANLVTIAKRTVTAAERMKKKAEKEQLSEANEKMRRASETKSRLTGGQPLSQHYLL